LSSAKQYEYVITNSVTTVQSCWIELRRVVNSIYTCDATPLDSWVSSASQVWIGYYGPPFCGPSCVLYSLQSVLSCGLCSENNVLGWRITWQDRVGLSERVRTPGSSERNTRKQSVLRDGARRSLSLFLWLVQPNIQQVRIGLPSVLNTGNMAGEAEKKDGKNLEVVR